MTAPETPAPEAPKPAPAPPKVWLNRLTIHKFRNVAPTTLTFSRSFNVLLGINASGKTTLLKLIAACLRGELAAYKNEKFDLEFDLQTDKGRATVRTQNSPPGERDFTPIESHGTSSPVEAAPGQASAQVDVVSSKGARVASISLPFVGTMLDEKGREVRPERIRVNSPLNQEFLLEILDALTSNRTEVEEDVLSLLVHGLLKLRNMYRFDESLQFLDSISNRQDTNAEEAPPRFEIVLRINAHTRRPRSFQLSQVARQLADPLFLVLMTRGVPADGGIKLDDKELPFLDTFATAAGFTRAQALLTPLSEEAGGDTHVILFAPLKFRFYSSEGQAYVSESLLSYGQKRLLSFLYYVACNEHCVVADELVNGLHHAWITVCLDAIGQRQAFLTSQNPLLLDYLGPGSAEEARERFIQCKLEEREGGKMMVWQNLEPAVAEQFYRDYQAGVMQVSELLRAHNLW